MADTKRKPKMSRKMRRTVRKSVAGVCLVSSLIVAAIPATPTTAYVSPGTAAAGGPTTYTYGVEETDSTNLALYDTSLSGIVLDRYNSPLPENAGYGYGGNETNLMKTYMVRKLSDGSFDYNWQFKIYEQIVNGSPYAIICKYNDTYASGSVSIGATIPLSYCAVEKSYYDAYVQAHKTAQAASAATATVTLLDGSTQSVKSRYSIDKVTQVNENIATTDDYWLNKYFPTEYNAYKTNYSDYMKDMATFEKFKNDMADYHIAMVDWRAVDAAHTADPDNNPPAGLMPPAPQVPTYSDSSNYPYSNATLVTVGTAPDTAQCLDPSTDAPVLTCYVGQLENSADEMYKYFCEAEPSYKDMLGGDDYVLDEVKDSRGGTGGLTNQYVYMPRGTANKSFSSSSKNDEFGFRINSLTSVIGIGARAFENTTNVTELNLAGEVKYIGDYAFYKSFVNKVTFENVQDIGNRAFKDCTKLTSIGISDTTVNIGTEAFYGCNMLDKVALSQSITYVGPGAFADCLKLTELDLSAINQACNISDFAFYNDIALANVKLSENIARLGEGCFACTKGVSGNLLSFKFPDHISGKVKEYDPNAATASDYEDRDPIGNFVLAGRTNLQHVTMPSDYGKNVAVELPYGVFFNDIALLDVTFPAEGGACGYVTYGKYDDGTVKRTIFDTIQTQQFCVYGPESDLAGNIASPRKSTWGLKSGLGNDIPYIYIDKNGKEQVEISNGQYILIIDDNGVLQSCQFATQTQADDAKVNGLDLDIPEYVGDTKVTGIASNCFSDPTVHPYIKTLKIADNTISEIAPSAFKDCSLLESVEIGNSVKKIGDSAFENCPKLTYVKFNTPAGGYASFPVTNIGDKAFSTNSDQLTFEGDIDESYGPFVWATDINNYVDPAQGTRVCYQTGAPYFLTVIVDNRNNLPTLVDYPHYEQLNKLSGTAGAVTNVNGTDIPTDLITRYEHLGQEIMDVSSGEVAYTYTMSLPEEKLVNAVINVDVPSGVKSIDAYGFMNNKSPLADGISATTTNTSNVSKYLLAKDDYATYKSKGLFNGYYGTYAGSDGKREYAVGDSLELDDQGNDRVESITLHSVEYLPDYAFQSCERLTSLNLGDSLTEMGVAPFTGCSNLSSIGSSTDDFICYNGIVYSKNDNGNYELVEVLSSRGKLVGSQKIKPSEEDPNLAKVEEFRPGAFEDCDYITGVDLRGADLLDEIPDDCFKNCDKLNQVILPENITAVGHDALKGTMDGVELVVYGKEVYLPKDAFGSATDQPTSYRVISYKDSAVRKAAKDIGADVSETLDDTVKVQFMDFDGTELSNIIFVTVGGSVQLEDIPADPVREGYTFAGWNKPLTNITTDTIIVATYKMNENTTPDNGNGNGGNGGSGDVSGNNGNGSGNNGGSNSGTNNGTTNSTLYTLLVTNGNGSGSYAAGATVIITCTNPPTGQVFDKWVPDTDDLGIASVNVAATTLTMPAHNANVTATFKTAPAGGSGSSSSSGSNNSGTNNNNVNGGTQGNTVLISKPGISNTSLASATVNGSTDNYVIRITETPQATQAVEKALTNEYGNLDNIRFSAMDISLYDSTGATKITDTTGLSITITMPIPDALTTYAGNNKVAGVVNEKLDKLSPRFTSIDGVPCVTFTATHFSPYTVYVDTGNLTQGTAYDETPKTGDFQPKWILAIGLFAMSIALFFIKDKRPVKKEALA